MGPRVPILHDVRSDGPGFSCCCCPLPHYVNKQQVAALPTYAMKPRTFASWMTSVEQHALVYVSQIMYLSLNAGNIWV